MLFGNPDPGKELLFNDPEKRLVITLSGSIGLGLLIVYFGFFMTPFPPSPIIFLAGCGGVILVATSLPAEWVRKPWTYAVVFAGNCIAALIGVIFEINLFRRAGWFVGLIYPFGMVVGALIWQVWFFLKPEIQQKFGVTWRKSPTST
jgi:hypothetical protein